MISTLKTFFSHSIISIVAFRFFQIFFGYDFGYFEYKNFKIKFIAKLACLLQSILITYLLINAVYKRINGGPLFWYCFIVFQYTFLVFVLALFPSNTPLSRFQNELDCIDLTLGSNEPNRSAWKWKIFVLILFLIFRAIQITYHFLADDIFMNPVWVTIVYALMSFIIDFVPFLNIFMFYSFYLRVYLLNENVLKSDTIQIIAFRHPYMLIVKVTEKYKRIFDLPVSTFLFKYLLRSI